MKRITFSIVSAALLALAIAPLAHAAPTLNYKGGLHPTMLNPARTMPTDTEPSAQAQPDSPLRQAHLNRLDRVAIASGSLNRQQTAPANGLDPHNLASVSPLQQMRLNHLNSNHQAY